MKNIEFSKKIIKVCVVLFYFSCLMNMHSQDKQELNKNERKWFASFDYGIQMSGIKDEDFVSSNFSPVYRISIGKDFSPILGLQIGYQGRYFRAISDDFRWKYDFVFLEGRFNVINFLSKNNRNRKYQLILHAGPGYFYHHLYERTSIHPNIGASNHFVLGENFELKLALSAIVGWDIYQGDEDILPNLTVGLVHRFN